MFSNFKCFEQYSYKSNDLVFMCSLIHISDDQKRLKFVNPTQVNQLELNSIINEKSEMFKGMSNKKRPTVIKSIKKLTEEKRNLASTHIVN
jgi:hypothetical protein